MRTLLIRFRRDESGATAIEYGLIAAGIAAAIILVVNTPRHQPKHDLQQHFDRHQIAQGCCYRRAKPPFSAASCIFEYPLLRLSPPHAPADGPPGPLAAQARNRGFVSSVTQQIRQIDHC